MQMIRVDISNDWEVSVLDEVLWTRMLVNIAIDIVVDNLKNDCDFLIVTFSFISSLVVEVFIQTSSNYIT